MKKNRYEGSPGRDSFYDDRQEGDLETYERMKGDLEAYQQRGIVLKLSGRRVSSERIAKVCCLKECGSYMGDYVLDEEGRLVEICFNRVRRTSS